MRSRFYSYTVGPVASLSFPRSSTLWPTRRRERLRKSAPSGSGALPSDNLPAPLSFHVVVPSLPGFGFSDPPKRPQTSKDVARLFNKLMVESLGYGASRNHRLGSATPSLTSVGSARLRADEYATSAGDWGTAVSTQLLDLYPQHAKSGLFNMLFARPPIFSLASALSLLSWVPLPRSVVDYVQSFGLDAFERTGLQRSKAFAKEGTGYQKIQGTRPGTIGQALFDNPVGILAWIGEKFHEWSDPRAPAAPSRMTPTHILNQVSPGRSSLLAPLADPTRTLLSASGCALPPDGHNPYLLPAVQGLWGRGQGRRLHLDPAPVDAGRLLRLPFRDTVASSSQHPAHSRRGTLTCCCPLPPRQSPPEGLLRALVQPRPVPPAQLWRVHPRPPPYTISLRARADPSPPSSADTSPPSTTTRPTWPTSGRCSAATSRGPEWRRMSFTPPR
jgi:hypothetical protein